MTHEHDDARGLRQVMAGGVVAAATETFFGLLADAGSTQALDRLFHLKQRDPRKAIALLLPHLDAWDSWVLSVPELAGRLADQFWPGPLTIALPARDGLDPRLVFEGNVAVRLPGASRAARLAAAADRPLTATSANISGHSPCLRDDEVRAQFIAQVEEGWLTVLPGRAPGGEPSTVVAVDKDAVRVLRVGAVSPSSIRAALRDIRVEVPQS